MTVTELSPALLNSVAEIERLAFHEPWSKQSLAILCGDGAFGVAVIEEDRVVAYGGMLTVLNEGQVTNVATHPEYRRRGCAAAVMKGLLAGARARGLVEITLEVRESNLAAIALYQRFGFCEVGRRPRFYSHPTETALIMKCELGEKSC